MALLRADVVHLACRRDYLSRAPDTLQTDINTYHFYLDTERVDSNHRQRCVWALFIARHHCPRLICNNKRQ